MDNGLGARAYGHDGRAQRNALRRGTNTFVVGSADHEMG